MTGISVTDKTYYNASNSPWTPELQARVIALAAQGLTTQEIGLAVGMTKNQIIGWLSRNRRHDGSTTMSRLDALHSKLDRVLRLTARTPNHRIPLSLVLGKRHTDAS